MLKNGEQWCKLSCGDPTTEPDGVCTQCQKKFSLKCEEYYNWYNDKSRNIGAKEYDYLLRSLTEKTGMHDSLLDIYRRYKNKKPRNYNS